MASGNLPSEVSSFVGRWEEVLEAKQALGHTRLLTLVGPGGIGKTRLAMRIAAQASPAYPDGPWFVALAETSAGSAVAPPILRALGARDDAPDPVAALEARLAGRKLLLVLDNCEHVRAGVVELVNHLLRSADGLTVLATSRHVLAADGERIMVVGPLRTAEHGKGYSEAAELFRARAAAAGADLDTGSADQVELVCRRLDGMPLALELAAVRLRWISLPELVRHLDDILPLLGTGGSNSSRQEALDATLSWSHDLCDETERRAWRHLSVFHGAFDVDAAQAVLGGSRADVVQQIGRLVDKSVVLRRRSDGPPYSLLETIRQFGRRNLKDDPAERAVILRHRRHYLQLASRGSDDYFGPRDLDWFEAVGAGRADLRIALAAGLDDAETRKDAARAVVELRPYWAHTGLTREGMELLRHAAEVPLDDDELTGRVLCTGAQLATLLGLSEEARSLADRVEQSSPDPRVAAELVEHRALLALFEGRAAESLELALDAINQLERYGESGTLTDTLLVACTAGLETGDARVPELSARNLAMAQRAGSRLCLATASWVEGVLAWRAGHLDVANATLDDALQLFSPFEQSIFVGLTLEAKASVTAILGRPRLATVLFGACDSLWSAGTPFPRRISDRLTRNARVQLQEQLGADCYSAMLSKGAALSILAAIDAALDFREAVVHEEPGRTQPDRTMPAATTLTRREFEVAQLVAEGLSNRSIAERLVIAPRTAEAHVEHIRTKLGFHSRTQIAVWVMQQRSRDEVPVDPSSR